MMGLPLLPWPPRSLVVALLTRIGEDAAVRRVPSPGGDSRWAARRLRPADPVRADSVSPAGKSFDARGRVTSGTFELHARATAESAVQGRHGFVPAAWQDGLDTGTATLAAELCAARVWEPVAGGYRILDRDAVQRCRNLARLLWADHAGPVEDPGPGPRPGPADAEAGRGNDGDFGVRRVRDAGRPGRAGGPPASCPPGGGQWPQAVWTSISRHRDPAQWWLIVDGVVAGNG